MQVDQTNNLFFYIDNHNKICVDNKNIGSIGRLITIKLGYRNYDILDVLQKASSSPKELDSQLIQQIYAKAGKKLNMRTEMIQQLFWTIKQSQLGRETLDDVNHLIQDAVQNPQWLSSLQQINAHFERGSHESKFLSSMIERINIRNKWTALKLDERIADQCFEDVKLLVKTRLIYSILGFQNTTSAGPLNHEIKQERDADGNAYLSIKKQGVWVPVKDLMNDLIWDDEEFMLASKSNPHERWNYFEDGLVPIDRFYHHEVASEKNYPIQNASLHSVAKISPEEMHALLEHAKKFRNPTVNINVDNHSVPEKLNCVVQFVSHPRPLFKKEWLQNVNAQIPVHCGIRLIFSDGTVYSTGFGSTLQEDTFTDGTRKYLGTINGQPTIMDYEEFRSHEGRIVTSIPIDSQNAEKVLEILNLYRKESIRFNILKQNCMRLGTHVLSIIGIDLNIRISFNTMLYRMLPDVETIPGIGKGLKSLQGRVSQVTNTISDRIPNIVMRAFDNLNQGIWYVPSKFGLILRNLLSWSMGGTIASPLQNSHSLIMQNELEGEDIDPLDSFSKLLNGLMDESASDIQHSSVFINWQLQQESTAVHCYSGQPNMNILPPTDETSIQYSEEKIKELKKIYRESTPVDAT